MTENELSKIVLGHAIDIHTEVGPGLYESVYKEYLAYKLEKAGLKVQREKPLPFIRDEVQLPLGFRTDLVVENKLLLEIKSVEALNDVHLSQILTYLKLGDYKLGLLINFNVVRLKSGIRRVVNGLT